MKRLLSAYQYIAPAVLTPLGCWLWWQHYDGNLQLAALAVLIPILFAYIVPGIGTNILRVWEFNTRWKLGNFRPHHGFVFGSATAIILLPAMGAPNLEASLYEVVRTGVVAACVLGLINWVYDIAAIRAGILCVYNQPHADGLGPRQIASDYAPWFFGGFGLIHAMGLRIAEGQFSGEASWAVYAVFFAGLLAASITLPTLAYAANSKWKHGHFGCRPIRHPEFEVDR